MTRRFDILHDSSTGEMRGGVEGEARGGKRKREGDVLWATSKPGAILQSVALCCGELW